ncbi:MAG: hypothetical protein ABI036_10480 [Fibrobacteria bacterium]
MPVQDQVGFGTLLGELGCVTVGAPGAELSKVITTDADPTPPGLLRLTLMVLAPLTKVTTESLASSAALVGSLTVNFTV